MPQALNGVPPGDGGTSVDVLAAVTELTRRLLSERRQLYDFQFNWASFGSWIIVAGTAQVRVQAIWDGKDAALRVERFVVQDDPRHQTWEQVDYISLPSSSTSERIARAELCILQYSRPAAV